MRLVCRAEVRRRDGVNRTFVVILGEVQREVRSQRGRVETLLDDRGTEGVVSLPGRKGRWCRGSGLGVEWASRRSNRVARRALRASGYERG